MTGLARSFETAAMRVGVTAGASRERKSYVFDVRFRIGNGSVTFRASYGCVRSRERKLRHRVIECRSRFPRVRCMALCAVRAELPPVLVFMAARTCAGKPQIRVV